MSNKNTEKVFYGAEPALETYTKIDIINAYNWYNYLCDKDQAKDWLMSYLFKGNEITKNHVLKDNFIINLGWLARILSNGGEIPDENRQFFDENWPKYVVIPEKNEEIGENKTTLFSKSCLIADVEDVFDDFYLNKYSDDSFDFTNFLRSKNATQIAVQEIKTYYEPLIEEIDDKEASKHLTKTQKVTYKKFINNLMEACDFHINNKKQVRKPRKVKPKPVQKLIQKLSYQESNKELKMTSINPTKIIGSKTVILYNTKTKVMTVLVGTKLTVTGSTIKDFDEKQSFAKTIRSQYVHQESSYKSIIKTLKERKGTEKAISGRVNADTIILKIS